MTTTPPETAPGALALADNRLLDALPPASREALRPHLEPISFELKVVVYRANEPISHVVFPRTGVFSLVALGDDESELVEVATIGNEGFVGLPVFLGADTGPGMAFSQIPGDAWRMPTAAFRAAVDADPILTATLNRYVMALFSQAAQSSFCNRTHPMAQRCARWLLMSEDRVDGDEFPLTHEFLSQMLGVRRASVSEAMKPLQDAGLIAYARGIVRVCDRDGLEAAACECYRIVRDEYRRLIGA